MVAPVIVDLDFLACGLCLSINFLYSAARSIDVIEISSKLSALEGLKSDYNCKISF